MRVIATDQGIPPKSASVDVHVNVLRNVYAPTFSQTQYSSRVDETITYGTTILRLRATDEDSAMQADVSNLFNNFGVCLYEMYVIFFLKM